MQKVGLDPGEDEDSAWGLGRLMCLLLRKGHQRIRPIARYCVA